jgi:GH25 family lysozyme M1 (1,4-beta-N-acetylmuramidase)
MSLSLRMSALLIALAIVPVVAGAAPMASPAKVALPPGVAPDWLERLNPEIDPATAAMIVMNDHPMGSQIRLHEGSLQQKDHPFVASTLTASVKGMDVSGYQGNVNWSTAWANGARFAYVKATEGTYYTNPYFAQQYNGSYNAGMIRASYHFARPDTTTGAVQADYFVNHGGGWSQDGKTLPGVVDLEYNPYGSTCYGKTQAGMASWVHSFMNEYRIRTTRLPVIYTSTSWWSQCVGTSFVSTPPLWVARYASTIGTLPYPWTIWKFWQYADSGVFPGDQDIFNGGQTQLVNFAN